MWESSRAWGAWKRSARLDDLEGGFDVKCRSCGLRSPYVEDTDGRPRQINVSFQFGPNILDNVVNEDVLIGYNVLMVTGCQQLLGGPRLRISKRSTSDGRAVASVCDCPTDMYEAQVVASIPSNVPGNIELHFMVVPITSAGALPIGIMTAPFRDFVASATTDNAASLPSDPTQASASAPIAMGVGVLFLAIFAICGWILVSNRLRRSQQVQDDYTKKYGDEAVGSEALANQPQEEREVRMHEEGLLEKAQPQGVALGAQAPQLHDAGGQLHSKPAKQVSLQTSLQSSRTSSRASSRARIAPAFDAAPFFDVVTGRQTFVEEPLQERPRGQPRAKERERRRSDADREGAARPSGPSHQTRTKAPIDTSQLSSFAKAEMEHDGNSEDEMVPGKSCSGAPLEQPLPRCKSPFQRSMWSKG